MEQKTTGTGRLAVKTSALTFLALMLVLIIGVSFYMLAFTAKAADFFSDNFGWNGLGARLSYAAYTKDKNNDINLLGSAAERAILHDKKISSAGTNDLVYQYTYELISHDKFHSDSENSKIGYAEWMDITYPTGSPYETKYEHYIKSYCYTAMYKSKKSTPKFAQGNKRKAVELAVFAMTPDGAGYEYGYNNPVSRVARVCADDGGAPTEAVAALFDFFETALAELPDGTSGESAAVQLVNLCADALLLAGKHRQTETAFWQNEYNINLALLNNYRVPVAA